MRQVNRLWRKLSFSKHFWKGQFAICDKSYDFIMIGRRKIFINNKKKNIANNLAYLNFICLFIQQMQPYLCNLTDFVIDLPADKKYLHLTHYIARSIQRITTIRKLHISHHMYFGIIGIYKKTLNDLTFQTDKLLSNSKISSSKNRNHKKGYIFTINHRKCDCVGCTYVEHINCVCEFHNSSQIFPVSINLPELEKYKLISLVSSCVQINFKKLKS